MLHVLLITPPVSFEERYGSFAGGGSSAPSLGLLMIGGVTLAAGCRCSVIDAAAMTLTDQELLARLVEVSPDILGISSTTLAIGNADRFARAVKQALPDITIIIGGPHITAAPKETMEKFASFDIAVIGEGEATFAEILQDLAAGKKLNEVRGIILREGDELLVTERRPFITDLDSLPMPAWHLLEGFPEKYMPAPFKVKNLPATTLVTARGCPNKCIFCDRSVFGSSCHGYSATRVVEHIVELHQRYGIREISFEDDTFITFKTRLREICEKLIELDLGITWTCLGRVNNVTPENLTLMRKAGCWQISFGIETGSEDILTLIGKKITLQQIRTAVDCCQAAGIRSKGFFIIGHPGETKETLQATIDLALELPLSDISATLLTPFPGTELYDRAAEFGEFDGNWNKMNLLNAVFVPYGLSQEDLTTAHKTLIRRFYMRPRIMFDYGRRLLRNPSRAKGLAAGFISLVRSISQKR